MTANELAVYLEDITDSEKSPYRQAATMLRQQQAEIEQLKALALKALAISLSHRNANIQYTRSEK
jgi:hypothetical protein